MSAIHLALHQGHKPISVAEFRDALGALCWPRFSTVRHGRPRPLALAISGGVDSMALAYLFASLLRSDPGFSVANHPINGAYGIIIDHGLRQGSTQEAANVARELNALGLGAVVKPLDWSDVKQSGHDPSRLSNLESAARTKRYQALGTTCRHMRATSLFFAHHRDDQYETVLMRLLAGHGYRGLRGIRNANPIPECYELHGVYNSGLLNELHSQAPQSHVLHRDNLDRIRQFLEGDSASSSKQEIDPQQSSRDSTQFLRCLNRFSETSGFQLTPLKCEEGGVTICRPLLDFDKNRLIATCEANNVRWFEDHTNLDPTLTTRNAIRYMTAAHCLPMALQKPAILALSARSRKRVGQEEAEARRLLLRKTVVKKFESNTGTLLVEIPSLTLNGGLSVSKFTAARIEARKRHLRIIASLAINKLLTFVTPELHPPTSNSLENVVDRLLPILGSKTDPRPSKGFSVAGVRFEPRGGSRWFLSRAPYPSARPLPRQDFGNHAICSNPESGTLQQSKAHRQDARQLWSVVKLWDGRFWIRVETRVPMRLHVLPFLPQHAKAFRQTLCRKDRSRLEHILKHRAPGKVRYSLPALYIADRAGAEGWSLDDLTLLALPSLDIHVPGLRRWIKYEATYKKVDKSLASTC
ncbi:hypothetical protein HIM_01590 [Hirsutella minnesotensis 3608]|nr:hypothetical protein HIM_01590 [Hirsutella minnesotensis 3608]